MKRIVFLNVVLLSVFVSCVEKHASPKTPIDIIDTAKCVQYKVDAMQTKLEFVGRKLGEKQHGVILLRDGNLAIDDERICSGTIVLDMNTLKTEDQDSTGNAQLTAFLMSMPYFNVAQYPLAKIEITKVELASGVGMDSVFLNDITHIISGDLTIKGVTRQILIPASVLFNGDVISVNANFDIDRTLWGIGVEQNNSISKLIDPLVNIDLHLVAQKGY